MVGRLSAKVDRHRVGMPAGTDVVPPMDILGPTRTADGLAGRRLQQTAARAWRRMTIGRRVHASRPGRGGDAAGRLSAAGPTPKPRLGRGGGVVWCWWVRRSQPGPVRPDRPGA